MSAGRFLNLLAKEDWDEGRIDIIGQNGNDGLHYKEIDMSGGIEEMYAEERKNLVTSTDFVVKDLKSREAFGFYKYKKFLTDKTDEDMLQHLYEELMDACVYIKTLIEQRKISEQVPHGRCC